MKIAWHNKLTVILFEEVQAVDESFVNPGALEVFLRGKKESIRIGAHLAKDFLIEYIKFIKYCEAQNE